MILSSASYDQEKHPRKNKYPTDTSLGLRSGLLLAPHHNPLLEDSQREVDTETQAFAGDWYLTLIALLLLSDAAAGIGKELPWWVWELITYQRAACCSNIQNSPPRAIFSRELPYLTDVPNEWSNHSLLLKDGLNEPHLLLCLKSMKILY